MEAKIVRADGALKIAIDGEIYPPFAFKSFRPNPKNISEFYAAGVRLYTVLSSGIISGLGIPYSLFGESWVGDGAYDFAPLDRQMDMFIENAPDAYFAPMFQLDTRPWYLAENPGTPNSFTHLSQIAGDDKYRRDAADYLRAALRHCEDKYGDRIFGYFLLGGTTTEWFSDRDYESSHPIKEAAYRRFTGDESARLPSEEEFNRAGGVFLDGSEREVARARRFHAELISDLILCFARAAREIIGRRKLLGLYYGYLFELGRERLHNAGHLDYERVFLSPDIDMISSPSAYGYRAQSDPSAFMVTQKTLEARGKLYFLEFDHRTHTIPDRISEPVLDSDGNTLYSSQMFPGAESKCKNETESLNLMYRDFLLCEANGAALWWFDMLDGWFRSDGMMRAVENMLAADKKLSGLDRSSAAEVAVFAEGESMYRVRKSSPVASDCLSDIRRSLASMGAPYELHSICDVSLPGMERFRAFIFVNQYDVPAETRLAIDKYCRRAGKTVLWLYAPGYASGGMNDAAQITELTGISVAAGNSPHGRATYLGEPLPEQDCPPYFSVRDESARALALYDDGETAVAEKLLDAGNGVYRSVYSSLWNVSPSLLGAILREGGVFVYSDDPLVYTYANAAFIGVYNASGAAARLRVPHDGTYRDLLLGGEFVSSDGFLKLPTRDINAFMLLREG